MATSKKRQTAYLTSRDLLVINQLRYGRSNKQIADMLCLTERTVKYHLTYIYRALGIQRSGRKGESIRRLYGMLLALQLRPHELITSYNLDGKSILLANREEPHVNGAKTL